MAAGLLVLAGGIVLLAANPPNIATGVPANCFSSPGACGYPDPAVGNVGLSTSQCNALPKFNSANLPAGTYWSTSNPHLLEITSPNTTLSNINLGDMTIYISQVNGTTINNVCMDTNGDADLGSIGINVPAGVTGTTIENSTISGINATNESLGSAVFNGGTGTIIKNNYVYNVGGGAPGSGGGNATVEDNYELVNATVAGEHYEPIYCTDDTLTINHNTLINMHSQTADIFCDTNGGGGGVGCDNHLTITNNFLEGGGDYVLYPCGNATGAGSSTTDIEGNRFARCLTASPIETGSGGTCPGLANDPNGPTLDSNDGHGYFPWGAIYGITAVGQYYYPNANQTWCGNFWDDNLAYLQPSNNNTDNTPGAACSGGGDTTPPTVSISAPASGATLSGTTTLAATAADNVGVASVQFKLDGANLGSSDTTSPYTYSWDTTTASNGSHTLTAVATDTSGNTTTSSSVTVTVNNSTGGSGTARGRPTIKNNTLVSDQGTLLRGGTLWLVPEDPSQYNWAISTPSAPDQDGCTTNPCPNPWPIFTQYHLNTVRLATEYGPGVGNSLSQTESELDSAIAEATANHMYAVIDLHWNSGSYDLLSAKTFWTSVAARYKNNTNVIFELLNEPVAWRPGDYTSQNVNDEETLYNIVHTAAPQTPVIMLSFAIPMNGATSNTSPTMTDVAKELTGIDWSNTAVGFHGYWVNTDAGEVQLKQNFPTIDTEFGLPCNQPGDANAGITQDYCVDDNTTPSQVDTYQSQVMEELGISWICWDCNSEPGNSSRLGSMQQAAAAGGWWWPADAATSNPTGDINGDGVVNIQDLSILLSHYGQNYAPAELDGTSTVDIEDLSILLANYGK